MLYLGAVSALQLLLQVEGDLPVFISPPYQGQGVAPALLLAAGCSGVRQGDSGWAAPPGLGSASSRKSLPCSPPLPPCPELGAWHVGAGEGAAGCPSGAPQPACAHLCPPQCNTPPPFPLGELLSAEEKGLVGLQVTPILLYPIPHVSLGVGKKVLWRVLLRLLLRAHTRALYPLRAAPQTLCPWSLYKLCLRLQTCTVLQEGGWDGGGTASREKLSWH